MYYLTVSAGQEFESNLAGHFCSISLRVAVRFSRGSRSHLRTWPGLEDLPQWLFVLAGAKLVQSVGRRPQFLAVWASA